MSTMAMARSDIWWNNVAMKSFTYQDWLQIFRMCKETFLYICHHLSSELQRSETVMWRPLSVQKRVAVCLWCLATPIEYHTIAHLFGICRSTDGEDCKVVIARDSNALHFLICFWNLLIHLCASCKWRLILMATSISNT